MFKRVRGISFDTKKFFQQMQNAQQEITSGLKNMTDKAKKEVKIVNRKARKVLATEDGGNLRDEYILTVDLDAGHDLFKRFQENWVELHQETSENIKKSQVLEEQIINFTKECHKCNEYINEFHANLSMLSDVINQVELTQKMIDDIGEQCIAVEESLTRYEDLIEKQLFKKKKEEMKADLSHLVETKHAEYNLKKSTVEARGVADSAIENEESIPLQKKTPPVEKCIDKQEVARQQSAEKQKAYGDAFLDQMNRYIQYGEVEKPIVGSLDQQFSKTCIEDDLQIDEADMSSLKEFLGPEVIDVLEASQNKDKKSEQSQDKMETDEGMLTSCSGERVGVTENVDIDSAEKGLEHAAICDDQSAEVVKTETIESVNNDSAESNKNESFNSDIDDAFEDCQE